MWASWRWMKSRVRTAFPTGARNFKAPGKIRVKSGGGHAGHNGLRSIHAHAGDTYGRVRIGVGHPGHKDRVPTYVLNDFAKADQGWLDDVIRGIGEGAPDLAAGDNGRFMNAIAKRIAPSRPSTGQQKQPSKDALDDIHHHLDVILPVVETRDIGEHFAAGFFKAFLDLFVDLFKRLDTIG